MHCKLFHSLTVRAFAKPGTFDRNASANPNVSQNRNFSNVLQKPQFCKCAVSVSLVFQIFFSGFIFVLRFFVLKKIDPRSG
jgi:hypothetical protein